VEVLQTGGAELADLGELMRELGTRGVTNLMVEGGGDLAYALWEDGLVDKIIFYVAPKIIGGRAAPGPMGGEGVESMAEAWPVRIDAVSAVGPDVKLVAYPCGGEG